jgi:hypothetical protein
MHLTCYIINGTLDYVDYKNIPTRTCVDTRKGSDIRYQLQNSDSEKTFHRNNDEPAITQSHYKAWYKNGIILQSRNEDSETFYENGSTKLIINKDGSKTIYEKGETITEYPDGSKLMRSYYGCKKSKIDKDGTISIFNNDVIVSKTLLNGTILHYKDGKFEYVLTDEQAKLYYNTSDESKRSLTNLSHIIYKNGNEVWFKDGQYHRDYGFAVIHYDDEKRMIYGETYREGKKLAEISFK